MNIVVNSEIIMGIVNLKPERRRKPISVLRTLRTFWIRKGTYPIDIFHVSKDRWVHVHMMTSDGEQYTEMYNRAAIKQMRKFNRSLADKNPQFDATNKF